jgi:hypothetical protein
LLYGRRKHELAPRDRCYKQSQSRFGVCIAQSEGSKRTRLLRHRLIDRSDISGYGTGTTEIVKVGEEGQIGKLLQGRNEPREIERIRAQAREDAKSSIRSSRSFFVIHNKGKFLTDRKGAGAFLRRFRVFSPAANLQIYS